MATASALPLKSILLRSRYSSQCDDDDHSDSSGTLSVCDETTQSTTAFHSTGKLKNLRNYYTRRRSTMKRPSFPPPPRPPVVCIVSSEQEDSDSDTESDSSSVSLFSCHRRRVNFSAQTDIYEIPSRKTYSKADKRSLWVPRKLRKKMMQRNQTEFSFDGRDWRNATEEEDFAVDEKGQLVHPVHVAMKQKKRAPQQVLCIGGPVKKRKRGTTSNNRLCLRKLPLSSNNRSIPTAVVVEDDGDGEDEVRNNGNYEDLEDS